ncbi:MAG: hypothetical protein WC956_07340 [bacterium]
MRSRISWSAAGFAAAAAFASIVIARSLPAQSLSDMDWEGFQKQQGKQEVQTHTNPFSGGVSSAEDLTVEDLQLTGIVYSSSSDAYALISGYLVRPGDLIAGYRVDSIEKDRVKLRRVNDVFVLALGGGI